MVPRKGFSGFIFRLAGEQLFLDLVRRNVLAQVSKLKNGRTHTFLSNNAQSVDGVSQNMGAERYYTWQNTLVDCREIPGLLHSPSLENFSQRIEEQAVFQAFRNTLEERSKGYLKASAFLKVMQGHENKRYNIRLDSKSKYEEFDIIRTGICVKTDSPENFKMGLFHLLDWEKRYHPDYRGSLVLPARTPA